MRSAELLRMRTGDASPASKLIESDVDGLKDATMNFVNGATKLGGLGFGTGFLKWVASFAAIYLLILDRTNWRTNMLTSLLVPYIFFSLPSSLFHFLSGDTGKWVAFIAVVLRLFYPRHFPGLARDARIVDSTTGGGSTLVCTHFKRGLARGGDMPAHWLLSASRTHQGLWWV
ncbi:Cold-regulated 413 plasma membrane protein 2 [Linum grandiflorum]